jgi:predicted NUDIX family NTP pyrophosphohydrolase
MPQDVAGSAGLLVYGGSANEPLILLTHPGGPLWSHSDQGSWSIPKGQAGSDDLLASARREFTNETGLAADGEFLPLAPVEQKGGKLLHVFAVRYDLDLTDFRSKSFSLEWPPGSGRWQSFPEIDRIGYFDLSTAVHKIVAYQWPLLLELAETLGWRLRRRRKG